MVQQRGVQQSERGNSERGKGSHGHGVRDDARRKAQARQHTGAPSAEHKDAGAAAQHAAPSGHSSARRAAQKAAHEVFVISVAAEITGMHAQTLRTYDRMGLVTPQRTRGGGRRYSRKDIEALQEIQRLSHEEGVNLAGIKTIIEQQARMEKLEEEVAMLRRALVETQEKLTQERLRDSANSGRSRGEIVHVPRSTAVVMWEPRRRRK